MEFDIIRNRLLKAQEKSGLSGRQISIRSGNAHSYWHGIMKEGKEPSITSLAAICSAMEISLTRIISGIEFRLKLRSLFNILKSTLKRCAVF